MSDRKKAVPKDGLSHSRRAGETLPAVCFSVGLTVQQVPNGIRDDASENRDSEAQQIPSHPLTSFYEE